MTDTTETTISPSTAAEASRSGTPTALDNYADLDLSKGGTLDRLLMDAAEAEECADGVCHLTDELGADPPGLSPQMQAWLSANVTPLRTNALAYVASEFGASTIGKTQVGQATLVPAELAAAERKRLADYARINTDFRRNQQKLVDKRDFQAARFQQLRAEEGMRDPDMTPPWYYLALAFVVILEAMINFESLMQLPFVQSPAYALGMTILVGAAVGAAAHIHGEVLQQYDYYFRSHDDTRALQGWRNVAIGGALLTASVALIAWSRYYYILPQIILAEQTGSSPPNLFLSIAFMTASNMIVYGVGAFLSFKLHDRNPSYPKVKKALDRAEQDLSRVTTAINAQLKRTDAVHAQDVVRIEATGRSQKASPSHKENSAKLARFESVDDRVEAALARYKAALVKSMRGRGLTPAFVQERVTRDDAARTETLSAEAFLGRPVKLRM
jgi:hypothetical protein